MDFKSAAYEKIKQEIVSGNLAPGTVLNEREYAQKLGISRTPVHEAVWQLVGEGLLEVIPRRGTLVSHISMEDIRQMYEFRKMLEPQIVQLAAARADREKLKNYRAFFEKLMKEAESRGAEEAWKDDRDGEFHVFLAETMGNHYAVCQMRLMMTQTLRIRSLSNIRTKKRCIESCAEHINIINAILEDNAKKAAELMLVHLKNSEQGYRNMLTGKDVQENNLQEAGILWI